MGTLTNGVISTTYKKLVFTNATTGNAGNLFYTLASDGTTDTALTTLTSPMTLTGLITATAGIKLTNGTIFDSSGNESIVCAATGTAVSYLEVTNSATGNPVIIKTAGETNVGLTLTPAGTGLVTCTPDLVVTGDVIITGNDIKSGNGGGSTTAITLSSDDVTVVGDLTVTGTSSGKFTLGADSDGVDRSIVFGHTTSKSIVGIDDTHDSLIMNVSINAFHDTLLNNDLILDGSGNLTLGNGELRTTGVAFTDGDDCFTIADGGAPTFATGITVTGNLTFTGARDIVWTASDGLEFKADGSTAYLTFASGAITVSQPTTFSGKALLSGNSGPSVGGGMTDGDLYKSWVERCGDVIKTSILIDIAGLRHTAAGDIIGNDGGSICHIGEITDALNGTIFAGRMTCFEAPSAADLDLYQASVGSGGEDTAISTIIGQTELINSGNWVLGDVKLMTQANLPENTDFLYLVNQVASDADYTTGRFLIEMWGTV